MFIDHGSAGRPSVRRAMSGVGMDTLNFVVYMALLTEGGLVLRWIYKHGPPGGGQAHHFSAKQESRMAGRPRRTWYERLIGERRCAPT